MSYEPTIITRAQWKAKAPTGDTTRTTRSHALVYHHSVTDRDADPIKTVQAIQRGHQGHGSLDIEYNWLVAADGRILEGCCGQAPNGQWSPWFGRNAANGAPEQTIYGFHPELANLETISVCLLGQFQPDLPPDKGPEYKPLTLEAKRAMAWLAAAHLFVYGDCRVWGHREVVRTACPGDDVFAFVKSGLHIPLDAEPTPDPTRDTTIDTEAIVPKLRTLKQGDSGLDVRNLQALLNVRGAGLDVDGRFGPSTGDAIEKYLSDRDLRNLDGSVLREAEGWVWESLLTREDG